LPGVVGDRHCEIAPCMGGHPGGSCQCEGRFKLAIVAYVADLDGALGYRAGGMGLADQP